MIPNYFNPEDFDYCPEKKEDYFLYLGRIIKGKGLNIAIDTIKGIAGYLKIAGQGEWKRVPSTTGEIIEHVGFADADKRRELLSKAKALFVPTIYIEPFGGVAVEAMLSGTPVISTDWGAFPETVLHGITGYRCRTLDHFIWAAQNTENIRPQDCREWALNNFSLDRVGEMYEEYFDMLSGLWGKKGWYQQKDRNELSWLNKHFPVTEPTSRSHIPNKETHDQPMLIQNSENEPDYALDLNWYKKEKPAGISFLLRAKNEQHTIGMALDSLQQIKIPYEVNVVLNECHDATEEIVRNMSEQNIHIYQYPFQLGKTGLENHCTPVVSVHSTIWLLNWALLKGSFSYTFRWDADFIMTASLAKELNDAFDNNFADIVNINAIFSDTGKRNTEPYLWSNELIPRYLRYSLWHLTRFGKKAQKITTLQNSIIHDSPLTCHKPYWESQPWWEMDQRKETEDLKKKCKLKYEELREKIGKDCTVKGRASCPETEELAKRIRNILGIDIDEIPALKTYASHLR